MTSSSPAPEASASPPAVTATAQKVTTSYEVTLTARQANDFYNEAYRLQRDNGPAFRESWATIAAIYDALYEAGCDGTR